MKRVSASLSGSSAERPADGAPCSSAERLADSAKKRRTCEEQEKLQCSVQYISFPSKSYRNEEERSIVIDALRQSKEANISVINLTFAREEDIWMMWDDITTEMTSKSSVAQPAFQWRSRGKLLTFFSDKCGDLVSEANIDPEGGVPSICLTFDGPAGTMTIINAFCFGLPTTTKKRLLAAYLKPATESSNCTHIVGGELGGPILIENCVHSLDLDYEISVDVDLCVAAKSSHDLSECVCLPGDSSTANALVIQLWQQRASAPDSDARPVRPTLLKRKAAATASSSDAHPAKTQASSSDAHPARPTRPRRKAEAQAVTAADSDAHPASVTLQARTPLWDKFFDKMELDTSRSPLREFIEAECFRGTLCYRTPYGDWLDKPVPLAVKMESLLEKAAEKRRHVLNKLRRSAVQPVVNTTYEIAEHDMVDMCQRGSLERSSLSLGVMGGRLG